MPDRSFPPTDVLSQSLHLLGDGQVLQFNRNNEEITDTVGVAHGQTQMYVSGSTIVIKVFDAAAVAWRSLTAS